MAGVIGSLPGVDSTVRLFKHWESPLVAVDEKAFVEESFYFADSSFFDVFSFRLMRGEAASVLAAPRSVVLTESAARRYFADTDPMGQTILYDGEDVLTVTGIMADSPRQSHIHPDMVASMSTLPLVSYSGILDEWWVFYTYIVLRAEAEVDAVQNRAETEVSRAMGYEEPASLRFVPITDIHLSSHLADELEVNGDRKYVLLLSAVGLLVLLIACINYMNLATARASTRAREIGVRKSAGAARSQIAGQFVGESMVMVALAFGAAWLLVLAAGPMLEGPIGKNLIAPLMKPVMIPAGLGLIVTVGLLAGSYPALAMATVGFQSIRAAGAPPVGSLRTD